MQAAVSPGSAQPQPRLFDRVRDAIARRHYSARTEEAYVHWIKPSSISMASATRSISVKRRSRRS